MKTIWCVQRVGRRLERGVLRFRTWRSLSHLGLTGLGGWVTTGHTPGGTQRPGFRLGQRNTLNLYACIKTRLTSRGCDQCGKSPPAKHWLVLAVVGPFIQPVVPEPTTIVHLYAFGAARDLVLEIKAFNSLSCRCILGMDLETLSPL